MLHCIDADLFIKHAWLICSKQMVSHKLLSDLSVVRYNLWKQINFFILFMKYCMLFKYVLSHLY